MHSSSHIALSDTDILNNIADRLLELASDTAQIVKSVSCLTAALNESLSSSTIHDLQKLDNLQQSLCDLARLSAALAGPDEFRDEAIGLLKLTATRTLVQQNVDENRSTQGSVDLF